VNKFFEFFIEVLLSFIIQDNVFYSNIGLESWLYIEVEWFLLFVRIFDLMKTPFLMQVIFVDAHSNDKGDTLSASYYHTVSPLTSTAVGAELTHSFSSNENILTIGTQHALDPLTTVKARLNNYGKVSALIQNEWRPKSLFTISGEVDTKAIEKSAKVGLALSLKP